MNSSTACQKKHMIAPMPSIVVPRPDLTIDEVAGALRQGLGDRYQVRGDEGESDQLTVGRGPGRLFRARVAVSYQDAGSTLHVSAGGFSLLLRIINRWWLVAKVAGALRTNLTAE